MSHIVFLDSGPLGLVTHPQYGSAEVVEATNWLSRSIVAGSCVIVPAIVYYELKRELLRARKILSLGRLTHLLMRPQIAILACRMKHYDWPLNSGRSRGKRAD